jgi:hypothetical protein
VCVDIAHEFVLISVQRGLGRDRGRYDGQIKMAVIALVQASSPLLLLRSAGFETEKRALHLLEGENLLSGNEKMSGFSYCQSLIVMIFVC